MKNLELENKILREAIQKIAAIAIDDDDDPEHPGNYIWLNNVDTTDALYRAVQTARKTVTKLRVMDGVVVLSRAS